MSKYEFGETLDLSIKKAETGASGSDKAYETPYRRYENYIDNEAWDAFIGEMRINYPSIYEELANGSGDELGIKKTGRPPKMASYGSSSRMIYLLSRDIPGFAFEKKLPTTVGGIANIDGCLFCDDTHFYIEAKCREPYSHRPYPINRKYEALYRYLDQEARVDFNCKITILDNNKMDVLFVSQGKAITCFDIKQMISHLLGIATRNLKYPTEEKIRFLYLLYNPNLIEIINPEHKAQILSIYDTETAECDSIPFKDLYKAIMQYLYKYKGIGTASEDKVKEMSDNFAFTRCDQASYRQLLI